MGGKPARVIVVNDYGHAYGGAAQVAISGLNSLSDAGVDVVFVSGVGPIDPLIDQNKVRCVNFGLSDLLGNSSRLSASMRGIWDSRCAKGLSEVLSKCDPRTDIVHLHSWVKSLSSSVARAAVSSGFKLVCTLHDYFSACPNGGLYNFPEQTACSLRPMSLDCLRSNCDSRNYGHKLWRAGRWIAQDRLGGIPRNIDGFITVSSYSERLLRPFLPQDAKFYPVPNPIQIDKGEAASVERNTLFTFVGRLSREKGPELFATAALSSGVRAVFAGSGPLEGMLSAKYPNAEYLGWLDRASVIRAMRSCRALVFPSLWHETQGMVVTEAAALGVPSIVSDACAASEAIRDGETGLLFKAGDSVDLAVKLRMLDRDPELAAELGLRAYETYWTAPATMETHISGLMSCYGDVLSSRA